MFICVYLSQQKKKQYEIDLQRFIEVSTRHHKFMLLKQIPLNSWSREALFIWHFVLNTVSLQSLPEEERERVCGEEKLGGKMSIGGAGSPLRAKSPCVKVGMCKMSLFIYMHAVMLLWYAVWIRMSSSFFLLCRRNGVVTLSWINGGMAFQKRSETIRIRKHGFLKHRRLQRRCGSRAW